LRQLLLDLEGNDSYVARDVAQASAIGGAGILIDRAGRDDYDGIVGCEGAGLFGVGILADGGGEVITDQHLLALL
jgi:hypothetical protein